MADETTPVAPTPEAPAPEASVATPEPTNPSPEAPAPVAPEIGAEQVAKYLGTDVETLEKFTTFTKNNGQFDGAFKRMKDAISRPQELQQPVTQPEAPQAPSAQQMVQQAIQNPQVPQNASHDFRAGSISMEEMAAMQYFDSLAADPKYANIADEIKSGAVLKGLKDFNINPLENGRINDGDVRKYLDLYAATKPAKPTSSEPANSMAMADDLSNIKEVTTMDEANRIELENIRRRAAGQPDHPMYAKAREFVKAFYQNQAKKGR